MRKTLSLLFILLISLALTACSDNGEHGQDEVAVIQNLAGTWDWPGGTGSFFTIFDDGPWALTSGGDTDLYGDVSIAESDENFSLEFIVTRAEGAGAYGSPGIPEGEGWREGDIWSVGAYSPDTDALHLGNRDGSMVLMEWVG